MWTFQNPVNIIAGSRAETELAGLLNGRPYAFVTYDDASFVPMIADIITSIGYQPEAIFDEVEANPSLENLKRLCDQLDMMSCKPEVLVALGGGSAIDACKVLCSAAGDYETFHNYLINGGELPKSLPYIAIPTTSGTGSEVTCWATVWDPCNDKKYSLAHADLYAEAAVLIPKLTVGLPLGLSISTSLDALSHALESLWNVNRNLVSSQLAIASCKLILKNLPALLGNQQDQVIREALQNASLLAGLAFSNTKTSIAHNISYGMTLEKGTSHGIACSLTLPMIVRSIENDPELENYIEQIFECSCQEGADKLEQLFNQLGVSINPIDYGYTQEQWKTLIENAAGGQRGKNFSGNIDRLIEQYTPLFEGSEETACQL